MEQSTKSIEQRLVKQLSKAMLTKLRINRHKSAWWNDGNMWLLKNAQKKLNLLKKSIMSCDSASAQGYAADVANFCQMAVSNQIEQDKMFED
jgi:hypothetical protein